MMATLADRTSEADQLVSLIDSEDPYVMGHAALVEHQLSAVNEQFHDRLGKIKLLANRAEEGGVSEVRSLHDLVPLLFAHTAYKSYPESWLMDGKWDRMGKWLETVSVERVPRLDTSGVTGLDDWLAMLEGHGHFVSCSSGTTGKCAMMNAVQADLDFCGKGLLRMIEWFGLAPNNDRRMIGLGQVAASPRNRATGMPMAMAFSPPDFPPFAPDVPPMTIGSIVDMVVLRKRIAEGTTQPSDIARYVAEADSREASLGSAVEQAVEALIANRGHKLHIMGMLGPLYQVAATVRESRLYGQGFRGKHDLLQRRPQACRPAGRLQGIHLRNLQHQPGSRTAVLWHAGAQHQCPALFRRALSYAAVDDLAAAGRER